MMRMKLSEMGDDLRRRVAAAMLKQGVGMRPAVTPSGCFPVVKTSGVRGPNKTEAEYNRLYLLGKGLYEAVTLRLPGGSRYTPDWVVMGDGGAVELHEVKGSYRFGSHGRAATAFREAVAAFPCFAFVWAVRGKGGDWSVRRHEAGSGGGV